jgi:hypothetical protein
MADGHVPVGVLEQSSHSCDRGAPLGTSGWQWQAKLSCPEDGWGSGYSVQQALDARFVAVLQDVLRGLFLFEGMVGTSFSYCNSVEFFGSGVVLLQGVDGEFCGYHSKSDSATSMNRSTAVSRRNLGISGVRPAAERMVPRLDTYVVYVLRYLPGFVLER